MNKLLILFLSSTFILVSCSQIRDSAGVNRKNIDEFRVVENPPLIIPPDFNLLSPTQLSEKDIDNTDSDLAKEILFGLNDTKKNIKSKLSTMESILNQTNAIEVEDSIRSEINEQFALEKKSKSKLWKSEKEILNAVTESERLRNQRFGILDENTEELPTVKTKKKKKKRFFFF